MKGPYVAVPRPDGRGFDVVRMRPTEVACELKQAEAEALAFAMNAQVKQLEDKK